MTSKQRRNIEMIRAHFEMEFDRCWEKTHTLSSHNWAIPDQMENSLKQAYSQGVMKAIDLIMEELEHG